jgi:hypothetical protein
MRRECGPITDSQLRQSCLDSFAQYEPAAALLGIIDEHDDLSAVFACVTVLRQ